MSMPVLSPTQVAALVHAVCYLMHAIYGHASVLMRDYERPRTADELAPLVRQLVLARDELGTACVPDNILSSLDRAIEMAIPDTFHAGEIGKRLIDALEGTKDFIDGVPLYRATMTRARGRETPGGLRR
jgi:hypothetical protein